MLGIKNNPKEAKRVKRSLDAEMGLGLEFMDFLDGIEGVVKANGDEVMEDVSQLQPPHFSGFGNGQFRLV